MEQMTGERIEAAKPSEADRVADWLAEFESALRMGDEASLTQLFADECYWRDLLAFTWKITPLQDAPDIAGTLLSMQPEIAARGFKIAPGRAAPRLVKRVGTQVIEAIFEFETDKGRGHGVLRLLASQPDKAWALMTSLTELKEHPEPIGERRPSEADHSRIFGGENWADRRLREQAFEDREPAVLIVGAGQSGLSVAARLKLLGVDALIVDKLPRVGDVWRTRYHALALHNKVPLNHMAYLPFPPNWPSYLPKDMLGNWLETYAGAMECNVWTGTTLVSGSYDDSAGVWNARVRRRDGSERELHPRHLIFANGIVGAPKKAKAPGLDDFKGTILHTHGYTKGSAWRGKRALVLGAGTSGHDIAQDLCSHGAHVKLIQRGSITVASVNAAAKVHTLYYDEGLATEDADLFSATNTYPLVVRSYQLATQQMQEMDKELLKGLAARGMKLDIGEDGTGHHMKLRRRFGGYYLNCGASELIVSGQIGLLQYEEIDCFVAEGAMLKDGTVEKADLLITATGYQNQQEVVRELLGEEMAEKIGPIWGIDADGELANMFKPTAQKGLWFMGGGFAHARMYSHYVALQIKCREAGLVS